MSLKNSVSQYGYLAKILHWLVVFLLIGSFSFEYAMHSLQPSTAKWWFYDLHKSLGVIVILVVIARLFWSIINPAPQPAANIPDWQHSVARINHGLLYLCILIVPVSGFIGSISGGFKVPFFRLFEMPALVDENETVNRISEFVHQFVAEFLLVLITVHVAAALWHHFIRHDGVLLRMLPGLSSAHISVTSKDIRA